MTAFVESIINIYADLGYGEKTSHNSIRSYSDFTELVIVREKTQDKEFLLVFSDGVLMVTLCYDDVNFAQDFNKVIQSELNI